MTPIAVLHTHRHATPALSDLLTSQSTVQYISRADPAAAAAAVAAAATVLTPISRRRCWQSTTAVYAVNLLRRTRRLVNALHSLSKRVSSSDYPRRRSFPIGYRVGRMFLVVCLFVCLFVPSITQKRMIPKCLNLAYEMDFGYPRSDMVWGLKGQKSRSQDQ